MGGPPPQLTPFVHGCAPGPGRNPRRFASTGETVREAAKRLGIATNAIWTRFACGWTEDQVLSLPKGTRLRQRKKGIPNGARPGVKLFPLHAREITILQLLCEGFTPRQICEEGLGVSLRALHGQIDRMKIKLDVFTRCQMIAEGLERKLIHYQRKEPV